MPLHGETGTSDSSPGLMGECAASKRAWDPQKHNLGAKAGRAPAFCLEKLKISPKKSKFPAKIKSKIRNFRVYYILKRKTSDAARGAAGTGGRIMGIDLQEWLEQREARLLSPVATREAASRGREVPMAPSPLRGEFQRDRDRIIHCQSFRRLMYKTQVFLAPAGDHYRTRLTHTLEVTQIARTMARALRLNEDLTEAAALGHDLGRSRTWNSPGSCRRGGPHWERSSPDPDPAPLPGDWPPPRT